jgi:prepilin-type N-terminal cleavage/methylation domain-containing protein
MWGDKMIRRSHKAGFTMIEMILVTALISMVGLAVYGSFNSGLKIWQRANQRMPEIEASVFFDKISNDLRNWLVFSAAKPQGTKAALSFPLAQEKALVKGGSDLDFGVVRYYLNSEDGRVYRVYQDWRQAAEGKTAQPSEVAGGITALSFKYYYFDTAARRGAWEDELSKSIPLAVRIDIDFKDDKKIKRLTRIIEIYVWGAPV